MKYFSTFSGIGGFELGIIKAYENIQNRRSKSNSNQEDSPFVLVTPKSTNTQTKFINLSSQNIKTMETSQKSLLPNYQTLTSSLEDSLAKHFLLLESEGDLTTPEELFSLTVQGFSKKSNLETSYWKTLKDCFLTTTEELSKPSSIRLLNWGIAWNGKCLTQRISESHRIGKECSLLDILEESPNEKYFLSEEQTKRILETQGKICLTP